MSLEQCTFSPGTVEDSLPISFSAIDQLSLLSGIDMPARSCENEQQTDGSPACKCGKVTSDCLTHPSTPEAWTAFMRDSLAKTLALLENRQEYLREPDQVFTEKSCASLAWFDQSSCSWKTYQQSLVTDWEPYSETWPRWGMTVGGSAFAHPMSERRITETDGFYLLTPIRADSKLSNSLRSGYRRKDDHSFGTLSEQLITLHDLRPSAVFVENMMGFPINFTDCRDWVTPKFPSKPQQPTDCSEDNKCSPST